MAAQTAPSGAPVRIESESDLVAVAVKLGAARAGGPLSVSEKRLIDSAAAADSGLVKAARVAIKAGEDPLGDAFCRIRSPIDRRDQGQFFTPPEIVEPMIEWVLKKKPARIIDGGVGSGRYLMALARHEYRGSVIGVDLDPVATLLARANLAVLKPAFAFEIRNQDFLTTPIKPIDAVTAFIGNPPYVRHHDLSALTKKRAQTIAQRLNVKLSGLAGLHILFTLRMVEQSKVGDVGCLVTSSEWIDTRYGSVLRELSASTLGLERADLIDPRSIAFDDAMASALIYSWTLGQTSRARFRRVANRKQLRTLAGGVEMGWPKLIKPRWSPLFDSEVEIRGTKRLGDIARVHRGSATGANSFFVMTRDQARERGIENWVVPCLTRAAEVIEAGGIIRADRVSKVILDLPVSIPLEDEDLAAYIKTGERAGFDKRYLCAHRNPWYRLGLKPAADIVATYMARQPPVFALNAPNVRSTNTVHGIYLRDTKCSQKSKKDLVSWLNAHRNEFSGRTYHGGLTKFEPGEMESIALHGSLACPSHHCAPRP